MILSSFAVQKVLNAYQKNLGASGEPPEKVSRQEYHTKHKQAVQESRSAADHARERFGPEAIRSYKNASLQSLEVYKRIQKL